MYEKGQRVVIRTPDKEEVVLVEEILTGDNGQMLRVKDPITGYTKVVNPVEETIVEHLED
ncbi:MAG: hypothetical protein DRI65_18230 [Chloroflexota bacterium]|nr:MAG: hypothetical protein DRI65_18230 [Chloroflexota bacterium]